MLSCSAGLMSPASGDTDSPRSDLRPYDAGTGRSGTAAATRDLIELWVAETRSRALIGAVGGRGAAKVKQGTIAGIGKLVARFVCGTMVITD